MTLRIFGVNPRDFDADPLDFLVDQRETFADQRSPGHWEFGLAILAAAVMVDMVPPRGSAVHRYLPRRRDRPAPRHVQREGADAAEHDRARRNRIRESADRRRYR